MRFARAHPTGHEVKVQLPSNVAVAHEDSSHGQCGRESRLEFGGVGLRGRFLIGDNYAIDLGQLDASRL